MADEDAKNTLRTPLQQCCKEPLTGFYRDGYCRTDVKDTGSHLIAASVTQKFLDFTKSRGNNLLTPRPASNFPGLKKEDQWYLCAFRWKEAYMAGIAPSVNLAATHEKALHIRPQF